MNVQQYNRIISLIRCHKGLTHNCMEKLIQQFPDINRDTLYSIMAQDYQRKMKMKHTKTQNSKTIIWEIYKKSVENREPPGIILRISENYDIAPCLVAKLILQHYFEEFEPKQKSVNVNVYLRDTCLIQDMGLAYEMFLCTLYDNLYSPLMEVMRSSLGQQYEIKLYKEVEKLNLAYRDEEYLRKTGYDKTPDCKLDVPIAVDGFVINWIESKALFGDEESHKDYAKNQYLSYWNRFGPGLVIYWFGYLESIIEKNNKRFLIRDTFPINVTRFPLQNFDLFDD